jgi:hypothetical protein
VNPNSLDPYGQPTPVEPQPIPQSAPQTTPVAPQAFVPGQMNPQPVQQAYPVAQPIQPTPQPQQQQIPSMPSFPTSMSLGLDINPEPKKINKAVLFAIIAGVLVLLSVAVILYLFLTQVSKEEYAAASAKYDAVAKSTEALYEKIDTLQVTVGTSSNFEAIVNDTNTEIEDLKKENNELKKLKAVHIGEGRKLYSAYDNKLTENISYTSTLVESYKKFVTPTKDCRTTSNALAEAALVEALDVCAKSLKEVKGITNPELQTYATSLTSSYDKYAVSLRGFINTKDRQSPQAKTYSDELSKATNEIYEANIAFKESVEKKFNNEQLEKLGTTLSDYLNGKKK